MQLRSCLFCLEGKSAIFKMYRSVYTRKHILDICIPAKCILNACPEFFMYSYLCNYFCASISNKFLQEYPKANFCLISLIVLHHRCQTWDFIVINVAFGRSDKYSFSILLQSGSTYLFRPNLNCSYTKSKTYCSARWGFYLMFLLYLAFLSTFSTFLWMIYAR